MLRRLVLNVYKNKTGLTRSLPPEPRRCRSPPHTALRAALQESRRALSSSAVHLCEKKNGERADSAGRGDQEERGTLEGRSRGGVEEEEEVVKRETTGAESEEGVKAAKPEDRELKPTENGKRGLLELLGAMKVEVVTKRRVKAPKTQQSAQETPEKEELESTSSMFQDAHRDSKTRSEGLSPELVAAVSEVASTLSSSQAKSELLRQLRKHESVSQQERKHGETQDLGDIIADMKVGKRLNGRQNTRPANQIRFDEDGRGYTHNRGIMGELDGVRRRKSSFLSKRLSIFPSAAEQEPDSDPATGPSLWDADLANQIAQTINKHPRNGFEEMIQWTREGKMWQYPIDNEAGLEECNVPFHEHVFLERHLEEGFPKHGPIRHFMELVITGLSKNHQLSVEQKLEHIAWFREYFQQKQELLKEAEAQ
ncbi:28S ribosomal protein S31, mitochondrial isoform X2 [Hoplias malabaricus]|uniref:28S ribosomal protein S31, mitochondrial isoform X2 n=1 Tax=Hoplias malabaricus TaxID=27720 RepID=UPI00346270AE